jgi:hypothetical protein
VLPEAIDDDGGPLVYPALTTLNNAPLTPPADYFTTSRG